MAAASGRTQKPSTQPSAARTVAAVDIGSNAVRMAIAEVLPDGNVDTLERLHRAVRLGQDTFCRGRLGNRSMGAAIAILRDYREMIETYRVERTRAVATSAAREAVNCDTFLDRVYMATGLNVEVIATSEESRLTVSAVRRAVARFADVGRQRALIADVGGGSTLLTVLEEGEIANSQSLRLGSIRLQEMLGTSGESPQRSAELLRYQIAKVIAAAEGGLPLADARSFVAVGGDARFAANQIGRSTESEDIHTLSANDFDALVERCLEFSADELARRFGLPIADAETLNPALLVYQHLFRRTRAEEMIVSRVSMRDGLLLELAREVTGEEDEEILEGVIHSAMTLAEKYRVEPNHARCVADVATRLFDQFQSDHRLGTRYRLLLRVAALLHEVGAFVAAAAHHKHSYYLIRNSEIFGLSPGEVELVALIARYHRRSGPKPSHTAYISLRRELRVVVIKLAAILRVADALDRGQIHAGHPLRFQHQEDELTIVVPGVSNLALERRAMVAKGDLFEDVYGTRIRLEEG